MINCYNHFILFACFLSSRSYNTCLGGIGMHNEFGAGDWTSHLSFQISSRIVLMRWWLKYKVGFSLLGIFGVVCAG